MTDGKVARDEVRGRMGEMLKASFDRLDTSKDGFLDPKELEGVSRMMSSRVAAAEAEGVGRSE